MLFLMVQISNCLYSIVQIFKFQNIAKNYSHSKKNKLTTQFIKIQTLKRPKNQQCKKGRKIIYTYLSSLLPQLWNYGHVLKLWNHGHVLKLWNLKFQHIISTNCLKFVKDTNFETTEKINCEKKEERSYIHTGIPLILNA